MGDAAEKVKNWATHYAPGITLFDAAPPANDSGAPPTQLVVPRYKWVHCCNEGEYRGHHQGPFEMTRAVFESFVRNFRAHPQFKAGTMELDGGRGTYTGGVEPVLQYDYEHASECPPWEGSIPATGAPACAWVLDLEIRNRADGKASLWAFTELLDPLREQIANRTQRWVSIAFTLNGLHWITREELGPMLTSIAITNHPFMLDLEPLAAANRRTSQPARREVRSSSDRSEAPDSSREPTATGAPMEDKLRERICRSLKIQTLADDAAVGAAVEEAVTGNGSLKSLLEALGVGKVDEALAAIPELRSAREKLSGLLSELDALLAQETAADMGVAKVDVGAAMKAGKLTGSGAEDALHVVRKSMIDAELTKLGKKPGETLKLSERRAAVDAGRKAFLTKYGVAPAELQHLTTNVVAAPNGVQLTAPTTPASSPTIPIEPRSTSDRPVVDLRNTPGPNATVRYANYLSATDKAFAQLPYDTKIKRVAALKPTVELLLE